MGRPAAAVSCQTHSAPTTALILLLVPLASLVLANALIQGRLGAVPGWLDAPPQETEDLILYSELLTLKLVTLAADGTLTLPNSDLPLKELQDAELASRLLLQGNPAWQRRARLVQRLYRTPNGAEVRHQIELWNRAQTMVAVRDNRYATITGTGSVVARVGDRPNAWNAIDADGRPVSATDISVPEHFRFVSPMAQPGQGDWRTFMGATGGILMQSTIELSSPLTIQYIGSLDRSRSRLPEGTVVEGRCPAGACDPATAPAGTLTLSGTAMGGDVALWLAPVHDPAVVVPDLKLFHTANGPPEWRNPSATPPGRAGPLEIDSADGKPLWRDGRPTQFASELNLLPVLGYGNGDRQGLAGVLSRRWDVSAPLSVALTIDSRVQSAAQQALGTIDEKLFGGPNGRDPYRASRRGAILALDPKTGSILAAASLSRPPAGLHAWDYAAARAGGPLRDPLLIPAWHGLTPDNAPGSTFKTITAMTGLRLQDAMPSVAAMIAGCGQVGERLTCAGLNPFQNGYRMPGQHDFTHNFQRADGHLETIADGFAKEENDPACGVASTGRSRSYGLPQAVRDSLNQWFIRLAELLDYPEAATYDRAARRRRSGQPLPDLPLPRLVETATSIGLFSSLDLAGPARSRLGQSDASPGEDALHPDLAQSDLEGLTDPERRDERSSGAVDALSQTAIGQRVQVSPLHMALVGAVVATGKIFTPRLIGAWNGVDLNSTPSPAFPANLEPLRRGMKMVTEVGTAALAFGRDTSHRSDPDAAMLRAASCQVFGKTGTAEVRSRSGGSGTRLNTAWFVGWAEPAAFTALALPGSEPPWQRRIVFACMITHVHGDARFGGAVCAPAIAEMLVRLSRPAGAAPPESIADLLQQLAKTDPGMAGILETPREGP